MDLIVTPFKLNLYSFILINKEKFVKFNRNFTKNKFSGK